MNSYPPEERAPASERLYVVPHPDHPLVVRGWSNADAWGKLYKMNPYKVPSLEAAHDAIRRTSGHVPESAGRIKTVSPGMTPPPPPQLPNAGGEAGKASRIRIENANGVIDKVLSDPEEIAGLKVLRLWP